MQTTLALSPILVLLLLLFAGRLQFFKASAVVLIYTGALAMLAWSIVPATIGAVALKALLLSSDILWIVFGAIFFLNYLRDRGLMKSLADQLQAWTPDRRIQGLLLAWLLGSFIEGTSGFGTPAAIVAPLLLGIGFPPMTAITICLIANSTAVAFGAVGTPLRIGFAGLPIEGVAERAALINTIVGLIIPPLILAMIVRTAPGLRWKRFIEAFPWAIFAGAAFLGPHLLFAFLGSEFPSILGGAVGLLLSSISLKYGFLVPQQIFLFPDESRGVARINRSVLWRALVPYALLLGLLLLGKFAFSGLSVKIDLGSGFSHNLQLFNPGFAFLTVVAILAVANRRITFPWRRLGCTTAAPLGKTATSIFCISATASLMVATSLEKQEGMLDMLAHSLQSPALPVLSTFVGAFGAFLAGSATVSNLLFGQLQVNAAENLGYAKSWILALQLVGAGAGNMIAFPNLLAVQAAVGLRDQETALIKRLALPCLLYLILTSGLGLFFLHSF